MFYFIKFNILSTCLMNLFFLLFNMMIGICGMYVSMDVWDLMIFFFFMYYMYSLYLFDVVYFFLFCFVLNFGYMLVSYFFSFDDIGVFDLVSLYCFSDS